MHLAAGIRGRWRSISGIRGSWGKTSLGLTGRYIYSNLASGYAAAGATYQPGKTFAVDISAYWHGVTVEKGGWNFGLALKNLGGKIGYTNSAVDKDYIPADLGLGASYTAVFNEDNKVMFGLDIHKLLVPVAPQPTGNDTVGLDGAGGLCE